MGISSPEGGFESSAASCPHRSGSQAAKLDHLSRKLDAGGSGVAAHPAGAHAKQTSISGFTNGAGEGKGVQVGDQLNIRPQRTTNGHPKQTHHSLLAGCGGRFGRVELLDWRSIDGFACPNGGASSFGAGLS